MTSLQGLLGGAGRALRQWLSVSWRMLQTGALVLALALSPSSYRRGLRAALARHIYLGTAPLLPWFTVLVALLSLVLIRIVVVTAQSYGLSQYALEMVVRVLVLELIPLTAALFVAVRYALPSGAALSALRARDGFAALRRQGLDPLVMEVVPRVLTGVFAVLTLAAINCLVSLVLAYLTVYGFTPWGFAAYTHTVGQVFSPAVSLIFALKTLCFSLAVSLIPMVSSLYDPPPARAQSLPELQGLVRMFGVILAVEVASLLGNYY
jgi:phospholipid/cholesterol/gamma-HCH transport system permease protein